MSSGCRRPPVLGIEFTGLGWDVSKGTPDDSNVGLSEAEGTSRHWSTPGFADEETEGERTRV